MQPTNGEILLDGQRIDHSIGYKQRLGYVPE
jgi:hypothetical protein